MTKASLILALVAAAPLASIAQSAFAAEAPVDQAEVQARQVWRETMHDLRAPESGCFHAASSGRTAGHNRCASDRSCATHFQKVTAIDVVTHVPSPL